jgi:hypothetical protein
MTNPVYTLHKLENDKKKYMIITPENKKIKFGDSKYQDFTTNNNDPIRKELYIIRHSKDNLDDINSAGFWSMFLLWNKKTIKQSIKDIEKNIKIKINQI